MLIFKDFDDEASDIELSSHPMLPIPEQLLHLLLAFSNNSNSKGCNTDSFNGIDNLIRARRFSTNASYFNSEDDNSVKFNEREDESSSKESSPEFLDSISDVEQFMQARLQDGVEIKEIDDRENEISQASEALSSSNKVEDPKNHESPAQQYSIQSKDNYSGSSAQRSIDVDKITSEICQNKFDELKQLISSAQKAVSNIISTDDNSSSLGLPRTPVISRSNSDSCRDRAGKYNKKPAPKAPATKSEEDFDDAESQRAFKATLVIKTGTVKTVSNVDATKDVFVSHSRSDSPKGKRKRTKAAKTKEGFSKLLTIPKSIFHTAFNHKDDESSRSRSGSRSRSVSLSSREEHSENNDRASTSSGINVDVETALIKAAAVRDSQAETYIDLRSNSIDNYPSEDSKSEETEKTAYEKDEYESKILRDREINDKSKPSKQKIAIRQLSHSPTRGARRSLENIE